MKSTYEDLRLYMMNEGLVEVHLSLKGNHFKIDERAESSVWHPVSEGLPEENGTYLVQCKNGKMRVCGFYGNKENPTPLFYFPYVEQWHSDVIAWAFLPAPFEGENHGQG